MPSGDQHGRLPDTLCSGLTALHGDRATAWLTSVEALVGEYQRRWRFELGSYMPGGCVSATFACRTADGDEAVLKFIPPWSSPDAEVAALRLWHGHGAVEVLASCSTGGAVLMRRVLPGDPFAVGEPQADARRFASLFAELHLPASPGLHRLFAPLSQLVAFRIDRGRRLTTASSPPRCDQELRRADALATRLLSSQRSAVLLHGDAISKNLLEGDHGLCAIDPMPCTGEAAWDVANWAVLHNPGIDVEERAVTAARLLEVDPDRVLGWAWVIAASEVPFCGHPFDGDLLAFMHSTRALAA